MSGFRPRVEPKTITVLTDFGDQDAYVGILKGVMSKINPGVRMIDITHRIQPGDIRSASFITHQAHPFFPNHTVHLIVVDPGVGTQRRPLAVQAASQYWVAPDNGVLAYIFRSYPDAEVVCLDKPEYWLEYQSSTFHGRDIFAPVAAWLSTGIGFEKLGTRIRDFERGYAPQPLKKSKIIQGEIVYIDHFGNCVSNIPASWLSDACIDNIGMREFTWNKLNSTYGNVPSGESLVLIGSHNNMEIAVCNGNAADCLNVHIGEKLSVHLK